MALLLGGAVAYTMPTASHLFPTALADGADASSCFALSEITATTSWCVKSCGTKPSICPPDLCSCSTPSKASASSQKVVLFVDPEKHALDAAVLQSNEQPVKEQQVKEQPPNASLLVDPDDPSTHLPAKALFKALEFGNPSAIGMANMLYTNETTVNASVVLQAHQVNQSAKALLLPDWRVLEFGMPSVSIANTTYMNGTVVAADALVAADATALQQAEQVQRASPANMSDSHFWRALEFGKPSESIANTTYMNGTVVAPPLERDAAALQSFEQQVPDATAPVNTSAKAFWRALEFGKPSDNIANTTYMNGTVVNVPATDAIVLSATAASVSPPKVAAVTPLDGPSTQTQVLLRALDAAVAGEAPAPNVAAAPEKAAPAGDYGKRAPQPPSVRTSIKGGMSFINFLSFKKSKDALPEDPSQAIEKTQAPSEAARNPWATRHDDAQTINQQQLGLAEQVALINAQGEAAMQARQAAAPAHEKGFVGILRGATDVEKQSAEERAATARKNFADAVAAAEQTKAMEDENIPGTFRPRPPVELAPAAVPGAIAFSSFSGGAGLFSAFASAQEDARSGSEGPRL